VLIAIGVSGRAKARLSMEIESAKAVLNWNRPTEQAATTGKWSMMQTREGGGGKGKGKELVAVLEIKVSR
jgi:hypothetical protein